MNVFFRWVVSTHCLYSTSQSMFVLMFSGLVVVSLGVEDASRFVYSSHELNQFATY